MNPAGVADRKDNDNTIQERPDSCETRREALGKMGRFAGYTAPVMLGLLGATKARANGVASPVEK